MTFCSHCGSKIMQGAAFCPNCGANVGSSEKSIGTTPSAVEKLFGLFGSIVGGVLALALGIIGLVVSFALPVVVIMAFSLGPSETWDKVAAWIPGAGAEKEACIGFNVWYEDVEQAMAEWANENENMGPITTWTDLETQNFIQRTEDMEKLLNSYTAPLEAKEFMESQMDLIHSFLRMAHAHSDGDNRTLLLERDKLMEIAERAMLEQDKLLAKCAQ